ncbi:hypothetical protein PSQ40_20010 [Curvibacter sp. HBC61]|uniref:CHASE2 domain-containing protein n=1 Tax=Curvibacter cyanobacteriorum TaxID=3026422 RepID=A0ABT5N3I4_9BURK|nr:hypothetical protein [Curvibacter sp. HBC61]
MSWGARGLAWARRALGAWGGAVVISGVRGSVWAAVLLLGLGQTSAWQYFVSTLHAHEFRQAAQGSTPERVARMPLVIAVDEDGYRDFFQSRSPLPRDRVLALMQAVQAHTPPQTRIAVNLPVAPGALPDPEQAALDAFWLQQPQRWVLPAWPAEPSVQPGLTQAWREGLCAQGVRFGRPGVPIDFGYPSLSHQFADSQAALLAHDAPHCADPAVPARWQVQPLLPASLEANTVIPFQGDLDLLGQMLDTLAPEAVLIGRMWGPQGLVGTPMGERYEVQVQAAALAGAWSGERMAPPGLAWLAAWGLLSVLWLGMSVLVPWLDRCLRPPSPDMSGHLFLSVRAKPLLIVLCVATCVWAWVALGSAWHAATGYWVSADRACSLVLLSTLLSWNLGRAPVPRYPSPGAAWRHGVWQPVVTAWRSLRAAPAGPWRQREQAWAALALLGQGGLPLAAVAVLLGAGVSGRW